MRNERGHDQHPCQNVIRSLCLSCRGRKECLFIALIDFRRRRPYDREAVRIFHSSKPHLTASEKEAKEMVDVFLVSFGGYGYICCSETRVAWTTFGLPPGGFSHTALRVYKDLPLSDSFWSSPVHSRATLGRHSFC